MYALKVREDLLKMANRTSSPIFDGDGVEIPKVGIKTYGSVVPNISF